MEIPVSSQEQVIREGDLLTINMGPQHPSTHGVFRMILTLDGETVVSCKPVMGYLHRSVEKLAEDRSYLQNIIFTDRLDYLAPMTTNLSDAGAFFTPMMYTFRERERILDVYEQACGARMTVSYIRYGGVARDVTDDG